MRISRIGIRSFGGIADRSYDLGPGLTVLHGPNESGKTSVMEFVRSVLCPTRRQTYPARDTTDSGFLVYEESGEEHELTMKSRKVEGRTPGCMEAMDPDTYRAVFAMGYRDLDDESVLTEGGITSMFIAVPGGERVPGAIDSLDSRFSELIGGRAGTRSELNSIDSRIEELSSRISDAEARSSAYGRLAAERTRLDAEASALRAEESSVKADRELFGLYRSQRPNYDRLSAYQSELDGLGDFVRVTEDDLAEERRRVSDSESAKAVLSHLETAGAPLPEGIDPEAARFNRARISSTIDGYGAYASSKGHAGRTPLIMMAAGLAIAASGAALAAFSIIPLLFAIPVCAVGGIVTVAGVLMMRRNPSAKGQDSDAYEREVQRLMVLLGREPQDTDSDVRLLTAVRSAMDSPAPGLKDARIASLEADSELERFYTRFAGREGFIECRRRTARYDEIVSQMEVLRQSISDAGLDPDRPECPVQEPVSDTGRLEGIIRRMGEVDSEMKAIMDSDEPFRLAQEMAGLQERRKEILREGAAVLLASAILDDACDSLSSEMRPGVFSVADGYLASMTCGRYRIGTDPRRKDPLCIVDDAGTKTLKQCSAGLRAQVLLSLKTAVAKEVGGSEIPMLLDDVLIVFDSERKRGALKALSEAAEGMQVVMFTCDDRTAEIAKELGIAVVSMRSMPARDGADGPTRRPSQRHPINSPVGCLLHILYIE
jgi:hypothetical protein